MQDRCKDQQWQDPSPLLARSAAVSFPIPVLAPVMRTVFPSSLVGLQQTPPAFHLCKAYSPSPGRLVGINIDLFVVYISGWVVMVVIQEI